jgi:hypothetical protein
MAASKDNVGKSNEVLVENQRRRKTELGEIGFELLQSVRSLFGETLRLWGGGQRATPKPPILNLLLINFLFSQAKRRGFGGPFLNLFFFFSQNGILVT